MLIRRAIGRLKLILLTCGKNVGIYIDCRRKRSIQEWTPEIDELAPTGDHNKGYLIQMQIWWMSLVVEPLIIAVTSHMDRSRRESHSSRASN